MASASLPITVAPKIGALLRMLASPADGEALNAARALGRTLGGVGLDLNDLADLVEHPPAPLVILRASPEEPRPRRTRKAREYSSGGVNLSPGRCTQIIDALHRASSRGALSAWEAEFASSITTKLRSTRPRLSARQHEIVERLMVKVGGNRQWA